MKRIKGRIGLGLAVAAAALVALAPAAEAKRAGDGRGGVKLKRVGGFEAPVHVAKAPGSKRLLFVVEQRGRILVVRESRHGRYRRKGVFADLRDLVEAGGERGLLSIAFPPSYRRSGLLYACLTDSTGDVVVVELRRRSAKRADDSSVREVIRVPHREFANHNGGQLQFGPDGLLYLGVGDGGGGGDPFGAGQDLGTLLGKILRIDPRPGNAGSYGIPDDNPFLGVAGARAEIYSYGLRNPWRFSFDRANGRIAIGDVGQSSREEVDYETRRGAAGANFGWSLFEGDERFAGQGAEPADYEPPIHAYPHAGGNCAITGGYVVRNRSLSSLYKRYVYSDLCAGDIRSLVPRLGGARRDRGLGLDVGGISSFGEGRGGRILVASVAEDRVWVLRPR